MSPSDPNHARKILQLYLCVLLVANCFATKDDHSLATWSGSHQNWSEVRTTQRNQSLQRE